MPIEGPLREFGIHEVIQLLDMGRRTGMLRLTSELRNDEGRVYFDGGKVVHASVRSRPDSIEDALVDAGRITPTELQQARDMVAAHGNGLKLTDMFVQAGVVTAPDLEQLMRQRIESIVFGILAWREGSFAFEEGELSDVPRSERVIVATESLLMEGARRIDEWSRIADRVPNPGVIPTLAPVPLDHESQLDLLPHEWEVLTKVDGVRDLHAIATELGRAEFEVAKVAYGLATTGVIEIRQPRPLSASIAAAEPALHPALGMARTLARSGRTADAVAELEAALEREPMNADLWMELGFCALRSADFVVARLAWDRCINLAPAHAELPKVRHAMDALATLVDALAEHSDA